MFLKSKKAFTLIEVLVVLFILVFLFSLSINQLFSSGQKINKTFERLVLLNRRIYTSSRIHRNVYRLVFKLNAQQEDEYWVEKQEGETFDVDSHFYDEPQRIPYPLSLELVERSQPEEQQEDSSLFFIYYYPRGLSEAVALQFLRKDNQGRWTLYLDPVTKELNLLTEEKSLEYIKNNL